MVALRRRSEGSRFLQCLQFHSHRPSQSLVCTVNGTVLDKPIEYIDLPFWWLIMFSCVGHKSENSWSLYRSSAELWNNYFTVLIQFLITNTCAPSYCCRRCSSHCENKFLPTRQSWIIFLIFGLCKRLNYYLMLYVSAPDCFCSTIFSFLCFTFARKLTETESRERSHRWGPGGDIGVSPSPAELRLTPFSRPAPRASNTNLH